MRFFITAYAITQIKIIAAIISIAKPPKISVAFRIIAYSTRFRPQRHRAGGVRKIHTAAGGGPDAYVEGRAARLVRRRSESNVERPPGLQGYEGTGVPIGKDADTDA
jgi:hypothetical protein